MNVQLVSTTATKMRSASTQWEGIAAPASRATLATAPSAEVGALRNGLTPGTRSHAYPHAHTYTSDFTVFICSVMFTFLLGDVYDPTLLSPYSSLCGVLKT